jgi:prefoldin subunit 4
LLEIKADQKQIAEDIQKLDDASTDIMLAVDGKVMLLIGEAFVESTEEAATEYCEKKQQVSCHPSKKISLIGLIELCPLYLFYFLFFHCVCFQELQKQLTDMAEEETRILSRQADLKKILYSRFGDSINLES